MKEKVKELIMTAVVVLVVFSIMTIAYCALSNDAEILSVIIREDANTAVILYDNGKYETMHIKYSDDAYHVRKMCVVTTLYNYGDKSITVERSKITYIGIQPQG